jgi:hypothetical protein
MEKGFTQVFNEIRDIPYRIPLSSSEEDFSCTGKNEKLLQYLVKENYQVRWRVCTFKWSSLGLPQNVLEVSHDDNSTHAYLEVKIDQTWKKVDATWDKGLAGILPVNQWDDSADEEIAVPVVSTFSAEESKVIMESENREVVEDDIKINGNFYQALNLWLEEVRVKS